MDAPLITSIDPGHPSPSIIQHAASLLAEGELVVIPTETVYGLASHPDVPGAINRIYALKGRPDSKPIPLMISHMNQVESRMAEWSEAGRAMAEYFWPGPLTLVLEIPGGSIGFRMPDHPVTMALLQACGGALSVTSANLSGLPEARSAEEAVKNIGHGIALALDAGPSRGGIPSTVVRIQGDEWKILREGAISASQLARISELA